MIAVLVPILLVTMSWNADDPEDVMRVMTRWHLSEQTCHAAGAETGVIQAGRAAKGQGRPQQGFARRCAEGPSVLHKRAAR
ncbi:MAG: hypothetical protein WA918_04445 [Erythrobacter sp.]